MQACSCRGSAQEDLVASVTKSLTLSRRDIRTAGRFTVLVMPEIVAIANATGHTVAQLSGLTTVADRVQCAARATNGSGMAEMREALLRFMELNDYLDDQAVPSRQGSDL